MCKEILFLEIFVTLKFNDIHLLQLGQYMYSYKNLSLLSRFNNNFHNNQINTHNTRNFHAFSLHYCRTNTKKFLSVFKDPSFRIILLPSFLFWCLKHSLSKNKQVSFATVTFRRPIFDQGNLSNENSPNCTHLLFHHENNTA